jgi:hypothetical protein
MGPLLDRVRKSLYTTHMEPNLQSDLRVNVLAAIIYYRIAHGAESDTRLPPLSRLGQWGMQYAERYLFWKRSQGSEDLLPAIRELLNADKTIRVYFSTASYPSPSRRPKDFGPPTHWFTMTQGSGGVWTASEIRPAMRDSPAGVYIKPFENWGLMTYNFYAGGLLGKELSLVPHNRHRRAVPRSTPKNLAYLAKALEDYRSYKKSGPTPPVYSSLCDLQSWESARGTDYAYSAKVIYPEKRPRVVPTMSKNYKLINGQPTFLITHHSWGCQLSLYNAPYYALANLALTPESPLLQTIPYDDFIEDLRSKAQGRGMFVYVVDGREYVVHLIERTVMIDADAVVIPMASKRLWATDTGQPTAAYKRLRSYVEHLPRQIWDGTAYVDELEYHREHN